MVKLMTKKEINSLANFAIIARAKQQGLAVYRDDLYINYAEMESGILKIEDQAIEAAAKTILSIGKKWLEQIKSKEDLKEEELQIGSPLARILFDQLIRKIWEYGQSTAEKDLEKMGILENWEIQSFAAGKQSTKDLGDLNADAYEWYDLYMRKLGKKAEKDVFEYMQPLILEHIESGRTGKKLADALAADFARYGVVRTEIIARTESTKAFNWGRRYRFDGSSALAGYRYSAILDERTTGICRGLHGHSWQIGDPSLNAYTPPNHFRCRSVLVPINKYTDFTFKAPADGWNADLPAKEKGVLERFMDSAWYPVRATVKAVKTPAALPAAAAAAPVVTEGAAGMRAQDIQSHADAAIWGVERQIAVEMDKIPIEVTKEILQRMEDTFNKIPLLQEYLKNIKDTPQVGRWQGEYAHVLSSGMSFNPKVWGSDLEKVKKLYESDVRYRFHPDGTDYKSVITHELGHIFETMMRVNGYTAENPRSYFADQYAITIRKTALKETKIKVKDIERNLSSYAKTNPSEFFAEAFCEYLDSPDPRPIAASVGSQIEQITKEIEKKGHKAIKKEMKSK